MTILFEPPPAFPFSVRSPALPEQPPCHQSIRALNGGRCVLCDPAHPFESPRELYDEVDPLEALDALEAEAAAELARLDADAARLSLAEFVRQGWTVPESVGLEWNWHHDALCANVQGMLEEWLRVREIREQAARDRVLRQWKMRWSKLIINICPGTLKSRIVMVFAPAWMWLRCPTWSVLCVSMNPDNVRRDAEACRDLLSSAWYRTAFQPDFYVRDDIDSKGKFQLALRSDPSKGGFRLSKGMGGKFTGFHVDACLMDDPDDAHDVHSESERKGRKGKVESISSRWNDKRHMTWIIIQQRVHVDDCTGELLARGGWMHASYPLHYRADRRTDTPFFVDPRSTDGENMHPERFTIEVIEAARLELGSAGFDAQYECDPASSAGNLIKIHWFRFFTIEGQSTGLKQRPSGCTGDAPIVLPLTKSGKLDLDFLCASVDASFGSTTDTASEVSIQIIGGKGPKRFLFEDWTCVRSFIATCQDLSAIIAKWSPRFAGIMSILVEKKANGAAVIEMLSREYQGLIPVEPEGGKLPRAAAVSPAIESGCMHVLEGAEWLDAYLTGNEGVCSFPNGKRDDRMDSTSQALNHYRADIDAMRLAAKNAALLSLRGRMGAQLAAQFR